MNDFLTTGSPYRILPIFLATEGIQYNKSCVCSIVR
jgi:hypothetical protein